MTPFLRPQTIERAIELIGNFKFNELYEYYRILAPVLTRSQLAQAFDKINSPRKTYDYVFTLTQLARWLPIAKQASIATEVTEYIEGSDQLLNLENARLFAGFANGQTDTSVQVLM